MSVGYFVQRRGVEPLGWEPMDFREPINLNRRLANVGQQIIEYSRTADNEELKFAAALSELK